MAVSITLADFRNALRLGNTEEETAEATRLLAVASEMVTKHAPNAPDVIHGEAAIRAGSYLFDQPPAERSSSFANALRNSGAAALLLPYRIHRAGTVAEAVTAAEQSGTPGNPVTNVSVSGSTLTVHFADGSTRNETLPEGMGGETPSPTPGLSTVATDGTISGDGSEDDPLRVVTSAGQARGTLIAVSDALPSGSLADSLNVHWTPRAGYSATGSLLDIPHRRPTPDIIGLFAVARVGSQEVDECFIPWGPSGFEDASSDRSNHALSFNQRDSNIEVAYYRFPGGEDGLALAGDSDEVPAGSTVRIYLARVGGVSVSDGAIDSTARAAAAEALELAGTSRTYVGVYSTLTNAQRGALDLGNYAVHNNRYWIVHDRSQARDNAPGSAPNDGWRPIDGQYRGEATAGGRYYDAGDHARIGSTIYFCENEGLYTAADIPTSNNWAGPGTLDQAARDAAAAAMAAAAANAGAIEGISTSGPARTEVLVPFRPGSRPGAVLIESAGYVVGGNFSKYLTPHYVNDSGGYTVSVDDARDFADEPHLVALLAGGDAVALTELPDAPTVEGLTGIYRDGNLIQVVSSRPSTTITLHFVQNVGGSRYFNPDDRVARFPHGGAATPDFNEGHQWIAGIGILAVGNDKRIELITDGDQPSGTLRISLAVPGGAPVEHLVVPLVSDPNAYHSGLVSNIPDGQDLEFSITRNGNPRVLHAGLHFERFILEEELEANLVPLQARVAELEDASGGGATVARHFVTFDAASYTYNGDENFSQLTVSYPEGLTRADAVAAMKTGYLQADFNELPVPEDIVLVELLADRLFGNGLPLTTGFTEVQFRDADIQLTLHGRELENTTDRDHWRLRISMVS